MNRSPALIPVCFCAGLLGALISSLAVWLAGQVGLTHLAGVAMTPAWTTAWLYPRLISGGLWGLAFFLTVSVPRTRNHWMRKGMWVGLLASALQLLYVYPTRTPYGPLGLGLGTLTPAFVLLINFIWGAATGIFARMFWGRG
jgi:multidrug efflux pump subunit AcrB